MVRTIVLTILMLDKKQKLNSCRIQEKKIFVYLHNNIKPLWYCCNNKILIIIMKCLWSMKSGLLLAAHIKLSFLPQLILSKEKFLILGL